MDESDKVFSYFGNQYVSIIMKNLKGSETREDGIVRSGNIIIEGFFLDMDKTRIYLGDTPEEITDGLLRTEVVRIFKSEPEEVMDVREDLN